MSIINQLICKSTFNNQVGCSLTRLYSAQSGSSQSLPPKVSTTEVSGLSAKVLKVPSEPTGPGASKSAAYKNPEYFSYHATSYFDAELEMLNFRLPQPSNKSK